MEHFIGIDLGTTYSAVSTIDEYGKPVILKNCDGEHLPPSVVYFDEHGNAIAGAEATGGDLAFNAEKIKKQLSSTPSATK